MKFDKKVLIWEGNLSKTYLAYDRKLSKNVILKEYTKENREYAQKEYTLLSKIKYKTPEVYELFEDENYSYIVREYIPGKTLKELIEEKNQIPPNISLFICYEILRFLDFLHSKGEFNGDITPSNIIVGFDGTIRILDFAKSEELITPEYYEKNGKKDISADIKALGKILDKMCQNELIKEISKKAQEGKYRNPSDFISDVIKVIPKFDIALEKELSLFVIGQDKYNTESNTRKINVDIKKFLKNLGVAVLSFAFGVVFTHSLKLIKSNTKIEKNNERNILSSAEEPRQKSTESKQSSERLAELPTTITQNTGQIKNTDSSTKETINIAAGKGNNEKEQQTKIQDDNKEELKSEKTSERQGKRLEKANISKGNVNTGVIMKTKHEQELNKEKYGYLFINTVPECEVWINGKYIDKTPIVNLKIESGEKEIELKTKDKSEKTKIQIKSEEKIFLFADLKGKKIEIKKELSEKTENQQNK